MSVGTCRASGEGSVFLGQAERRITEMHKFSQEARAGSLMQVYRANSPVEISISGERNGHEEPASASEQHGE